MGRRCAATPIRRSTAGPSIPHKRTDSGTGGEERELRAKYFDWCSARIAERFVTLTVPEIYALADSVAPDGAMDHSFPVIIERATAALAAKTTLPAFDDWLKGYRADPARYDADMIGFWKEQI